MRKIVEKANDETKKRSFKELFKTGFYSGIGWAFGATVGFVIISSLLVIILRSLGGLPLIGSLIASIVEATLEQLVQTSPIFN